LFSPSALMWDRVRLRRNGAAWVSAKGIKAESLISVRRCSGPTAWMVDHLVTPAREKGPCCELLEAAASHAGRHGAERIFLRLPNTWHLLETARYSGFLPCMLVFLLTLPGRGLPLGVEPLESLRPRIPSDDHLLFRLYNAATPPGVRSGIGITLQQWKDAQEPQTRGTRELVVQEADTIKAWLRFDQHRRWTAVRLTVHPDWTSDFRPLIAAVLALKGARALCWEVPETHSALRLLLERLGFETAGTYRLMVKPLAARVKRPAMAVVPTSG